MNIISNLLGGNKGTGGTLQVTVVQGRHLARKDLFSKSDPYCILRVGHKRDFPLAKHIGSHYKTSVINNNQDPVWNQTFTMNVSNAETELLRVSVYDSDPGLDDLIGEVDIPLFSLRNGQPKDEWYQLSPAKGGAIRLILTANGFGQPGGYNTQGMHMNQGVGNMGQGMGNMGQGMGYGMQAGGMAQQPYPMMMQQQPITYAAPVVQPAVYAQPTMPYGYPGYGYGYGYY